MPRSKWRGDRIYKIWQLTRRKKTMEMKEPENVLKFLARAPGGRVPAMEEMKMEK